MELHIHVHCDDVIAEIKKIDNKIDGLTYIVRKQGEQIMATLSDFQAALNAVDVETTRIANYIQELLTKLNSGNLNTDEETQVFTALQAATERLKGVGASVEQPVPPGTLP